MSRYLQKISLRPYSGSEIWTGWELEGRSGEMKASSWRTISPDVLLHDYGVTEFQTIPGEYLESFPKLRFGKD